MNILFVSNAPFIPEIGGVERVTDLLCKEFLKRGYSCYYITFHSSIADNVKNEYKYPCPHTFIEGTVNDEASLLKYHKKLDELKVNVIICQDGYYEYSHFFLNIGDRKIKRIAVLHSDPNMYYGHVWEELTSLKNDTILEWIKHLVRPVLYFKFKRLYADLLKKQLRFLDESCDKIVFLSPSYQESASRHYAPISSKSVSIPNPNTYDVQTVDFSKKKLECLFVGRLDNKSKNLCSLLNIWDKVEKSLPLCELSIVGTGPDEALLKEIVKKQKYKNVTFYGRQNPEPFYERASLFCMTSRYEGFPMCIPEAMCYGCVPFVYGSFASAFDVITNEEDGFIINPFNENEYAERITKILKDNERLKKTATKAIQSVERFKLQQIVRKWDELLKSV